MKLASILLMLAAAAPCLAHAQAPLPAPAFAVASTRPSPPNARMMSPPGGSAEDFTARMATVESMIGFAYNIPTVIGMSNDPAHFFLPHPQNLIGEPGWATTDKYDLTAKLDGPEFEAWNKLPKKEQQEQLRLMMRALLADRLKLVVRHETRAMPVYALVLAKGGPKFAPSAGPSPDENDPSDPTKPLDKSKPYQERWKLNYGLINGRNVAIANFVEQLKIQREIASHEILDQTKLTGQYDLTLTWASLDDPENTDGPSLFSAIQEQLGLKLKPVKAPMEVLVIDHIERPSAN